MIKNKNGGNDIYVYEFKDENGTMKFYNADYGSVNYNVITKEEPVGCRIIKMKQAIFNLSFSFIIATLFCSCSNSQSSTLAGAKNFSHPFRQCAPELFQLQKAAQRQRQFYRYRK